jgi:hypothetical protein
LVNTNCNSLAFIKMLVQRKSSVCSVELPAVRDHFSTLFNRSGVATLDVSADARHYSKFPADVIADLSLPITDREVSAALG